MAWSIQQYIKKMPFHRSHSFNSPLIVVLLAEEIPLDYIGQPFYSKNLEVEWKLGTNSLPAMVRVFKIEQTSFSQTTISNLMQLGGFSEADRILKTSRGDEIPENILCFGNSNGRHFALNFTRQWNGWSLYTPVSSNGLPEDVPDEEQGFNLATNILNQLDIPRGQLITTNGKLKAWLYPGEMTIYPKGEEPITRRSHMGVEFRRLVDGFPCMSEYVHVDFEWWGRITAIGNSLA